MRSPHNCLRLLLLLALLPLGLELSAPAAPSVPVSSQVKNAPPTAPATPPDYGGRESVMTTAVDAGGAQTLNPLAQAGRAFEALVIVLVLVVGGLYLLKRTGLMKSDGTASVAMPWALRPTQARKPAPAKSPPSSDVSTDLITVLGSQTLPHGSGAGLHLISVGGKTLLIGETAQAVTLLTELDALSSPQTASAGETPQERAAFAEYLTQAGIAQEPAVQQRAVDDALSATADRLQSLLNRSREETTYP